MIENETSNNLADFPPCCQREIEQNRKDIATIAALRRHDRVALAERRRRNLIPNLSFGAGCRCCYDPHSDGGEYEGLREERRLRLEECNKQDWSGIFCGVINEEKNEGEATESLDRREEQNNDLDDESDSDDEFDYLLDEFEHGHDHSNIDGNQSHENFDVSQLSELEYQRRLELELAMLEHEGIQQHGYGVHRQMHPSRVLRAAGFDVSNNAQASVSSTPSAVVLHFYHPSSRVSGKMDLILEQIATRYRGTKFLRSDGPMTLRLDPKNILKHLCFSSSSNPLLEKHIPCLLAIRDGHVRNISPLFSGLMLGSSQSVHHHSHNQNNNEGAIYIDDYAVEEWLDRSGVLILDPPKYEDLCRVRPEEEALLFAHQQELESGMRHSQSHAMEEEEAFCCGVSGCRKSFFHKHVGQGTEEQDGLLVPETDVLQV